MYIINYLGCIGLQKHREITETYYFLCSVQKFSNNNLSFDWL